MESLLPPNSTKEERALVEAIDYLVEPNCIRGFKFKAEEKVLPWLIEEYDLGEILLWVKNKREAIKEGVKFQRLRGTLESLKVALKWANIDVIEIVEEPPGEHFAEFQVGVCCNIPNDSLINTVIALAKLSAPARSKLMRIFNDHYNVQRFILDESHFGNLLSDYSGRKITKDGPVLSFGRVNYFWSSAPFVKVIDNCLRNHYEQVFSNDLYRLDVAILGETEPHTKNYNGIYERNHLWYNFKALYPLPQSLLPPIKFAKAEVVLSDSWNLGDINACFPVSYSEEVGNIFSLGDDRLSEQTWELKYTPVLERFSITYHYKAENFTDQKVIESNLTEYYVRCENSSDSKQDDPIHELENYIAVFYSGVLIWHEHRHLNRSWKDKQPICLVY